MNRRYALSPTKSPALTGGDDRPRAACDRAWLPFEVLMHETRGPGFRTAVNEARAICGLAVNEAGELVTTADTCPLLATCLVGNEEPWARAILETDKPKPPRPKRRKAAVCGTHSGYANHRKRGEKPCGPCNEARNAYMREKRAAASSAKIDSRANELRHLDEMGEGISEACRQLGLNRNALWKWCKTHGLRDVYRSLAGREQIRANQWTKEAA